MHYLEKVNYKCYKEIVSLDCFIVIVKLSQLFPGFTMDIRSYFSSFSTPSTSVAPSNSDSSSEEERDIPPSKKPHISAPDSRPRPRPIMQA